MKDSFSSVFENELAQVSASRSVRLAPPPEKETSSTLIGLAFSGGGIRSATFNLGVLQALAEHQLLQVFDYLSTVSGGGYIGSWLMGWMHHQGIGIGEVQNRLKPHAYTAAETSEPPEVRFLRSYSNYLTPKKGLLSADFWAFVATYLRNTLLNQSILILLILSLLLLPRTIVLLPYYFDKYFDTYTPRLAWLAWMTHALVGDPGSAQYLVIIAGLAFSLIGVVAVGLNLCWITPAKDVTPCWIAKPWAIHVLIIAPLFIAAAAFSYGLDQVFRFDLPDSRSTALLWVTLGSMAVYFLLWVFACAARWAARRVLWRECAGGPSSLVILSTSLLAGGVTGLLFFPYARLIGEGTAGPAQHGSLTNLWRVQTFGTPAFVGIMLVAGAIHIGLMGRQFLDPYREWWARLGGLLMIYAVCWLLLFCVALVVPYELVQLGRIHSHYSAAGILTWIASTVYGVLFGKSPLMNVLQEDAKLKDKVLSWAARATPYVFIGGLLVALSVIAAWMVAFVSGEAIHLVPKAGESVSTSVPFLMIALAAVGLALSYRVDINAFSIHLLYRNRLVRCYLGATAHDRQPQPFSGFSSRDDFPLADLEIPVGLPLAAAHGRPIPLLNASLNVTRGKELALQTRKARSFSLTPSFSGYVRPKLESSEWETAFASTAEAGSAKPGTENGLTLGTAVAISGAAASPNMGSYSSPALAFLMTLFDVRLGWWLGSPPDRKAWRKGSPDFGFWCLLQELFGAATDESEHIYLSDGGHFENLAIYELVRRRCKMIVVSDASQDGGYGFHDLHNAMERCRTDFGVEIELDTSRIAPGGDGPAEHYAVGTIRYKTEKAEDIGVLIYLKPVLRKSEPKRDPADLIGYATINHAFPHDSTANQWFDEDHFENYRNLGYVSGTAAAEDIGSHVRAIFTQA